MHIVFGGAFNGKREFVKQQLEGKEADWNEGILPETAAPIAVIAGLGHWVKEQLENGVDESGIIKQVDEMVLLQKDGQLIWILTDMNRGIVPADPLERQLRDVIGRLYQHLFKKAERITRIWYGIPQILKGADEHENLYENGR